MSAQRAMRPVGGNEIGAMSTRSFQRLAAFVHDYSGIRLPESKKPMLESRLRRRLAETGASSFDDYVTSVFSGDSLDGEGLLLINAVTTNKTDFFREQNHFTYMCDVALPELKAAGVRNFRCWSAACSTGAEPYTLAMLLDDFIGAKAEMSYGILATDLDSDVLEVARRGIYPASFLDPVPEHLHDRYVMTSNDASRSEVRISPDLRSAVGFARMNLMMDHYPVGEPMHIIFCRNVLIYFDKPTQKKVVSRLIDCLAPNGYLFLGHSESIAGFDLPVRPVANTVFQRS